MFVTRQATVTDAVWYRLRATRFCRKVRTTENPEAAGWPSSSFRFGGGTFLVTDYLGPTEPSGTAYNTLRPGTEKTFESPNNPAGYVEGETVAFLRLVSGSTTFDIEEY
mgnify:CR=1 FL=1